MQTPADLADHDHPPLDADSIRPRQRPASRKSAPEPELTIRPNCG